MATPGLAGVCFSCGQPLPSDFSTTKPAGAIGAYPLTGGMPAAPTPPANPYASAALAAIVSHAMGEVPVRVGAEVRAGRDPQQCALMLAEPRISGVHATFKFDGEKLWVRDEASNNGVYVSMARIPASVWTPVPIGAQLRVGPVEMAVRLA